MATQTFRVNGMTCEHCANAVRQEVGAIQAVTGVAVELHPGEISVVTVTAEAPVELAAVSAALEEAGDYTLVAE